MFLRVTEAADAAWSSRRYAMRTKFAVMKLGMTIAALVALAVESGAAHKFA
jgi:hypothetical protein